MKHPSLFSYTSNVLENNLCFQTTDDLETNLFLGGYDFQLDADLVVTRAFVCYVHSKLMS